MKYKEILASFCVAAILFAGITIGYKVNEIIPPPIRPQLTQTIRAFYPKSLVCHEGSNSILFKHKTNFYRISYMLDGVAVKWNEIKTVEKAELSSANE